MRTKGTIKNGRHLLTALAVAAALFGSTCASIAQAEEGNLRAAPPKAPAAYTEAMLEELREAQQAQKLMPYLLALHVTGQTRDGMTVRINVPVKFIGSADVPVQGLFPKRDDEASRIRLLQSYDELEDIFSEELAKISQQFLSTAFYQPARNLPHLCDVGSDELCAALEQPLQVALVRAQEGKPYRLAIVTEWINFYGFFNVDAFVSPADPKDTEMESVADSKKVADHF
jgi:hypothetical protein